MPTLDADLNGEGLRVCVAVARWNMFITEKLLAGAQETLAARGVRDEDVTIAWAPGAFELPAVAKWAAESGNFDAVICLGAVIRGETPHFDYVAGEAARGFTDVALATGVPVLFGVLTVNNVEQAMARAGGEHGHKGEECATSAVEMANLRKRLA